MSRRWNLGVLCDLPSGGFGRWVYGMDGLRWFRRLIFMLDISCFEIKSFSYLPKISPFRIWPPETFPTSLVL
jgi:hypothetical protein